jgi:hypothetical protein
VKTRLIMLVILLVALLSSCQQLALEASKRFTVELSPLSLTIARGSEATTSITIKPITAGIDLGSEPAVVTLVSPPTGVTANALSIQAGISSRDLTIKVDASATPIVDKEIIIEVAKGGRGAEAKLKLTIE